MHQSASIDLEAPTLEAPPPPATASGGGRSTAVWTAIILLALTALAGAIRFTHLERPPLLIDECFTFWRTCGSYGNLVETLRDDGFVPLHYEMLWWIKEGMPLAPGVHIVHDGFFQTPFVMRVYPAICGTLMVPVLFVAARQLFDRRTALLAAAFVSTSAYALFFSRDSKMYAPAWMLGTLAAGCMLWWFRTRRSTAWLAWVAAGSAAAGVHIVTALLLLLAPIVLLTQRRMHWRQSVLVLVGAALIMAGPTGYYLGFNRWAERSGGLVPGVTSEPAPDANWEASGLGWIPNQDGSPSQMFQSISAYLTAYEWDGTIEPLEWTRYPTWLRRTIVASGSTICGLLLLGMLPWPRQWRGGDGAIDDQPQPAWRSAIWLACWIVLPAYGFFYCRSFDGAASPRDWINWLGSYWANGRWPWLISATIVIAITGSIVPVVKYMLGGLVALIGASTIVLFASGQMLDVTLAPQTQRVFECAMLILVPATLWIFIGSTLRERARTLLQFAFAAAIVLMLCQGANAVWESLRAQSMAKHPELPWRSIWQTRYVGVIYPAVWIAAAALVMRLPTLPLRDFAIVAIMLPNLANGIARFTEQTQVPYDRVFADVWSAKSGASVRTYFDLTEGFMSGSGFPGSPYWRPEAAYNACLAGRIKTTPPEFRLGKVWPFEYGAVIDRFKEPLAYRPFISPGEIAADLKEAPGIQRVIIWNVERGFQATTEEYQQQLGASWRLAREETISVWWYWTWSQRAGFHCREFTRAPSPVSATTPK